MKSHSVDQRDDADYSSLLPSMPFLRGRISHQRDEGYYSIVQIKSITGSHQQLVSPSGLDSGSDILNIYF